MLLACQLSRYSAIMKTPRARLFIRRVLVMLLVIGLGVAGYGVTRFKRDFVDFEVIQQAGVRALAAEPLYRDADGHFQYKYLPAFAFCDDAVQPTSTSKFPRPSGSRCRSACSSSSCSNRSRHCPAVANRGGCCIG